MKLRMITLVALAATIAMTACTKDEGTTKQTEPPTAKPPVAKPTPPAKAAPSAAETAAAVDAVLAAYEQCRAALAGDKADVAACAKDTAAAAKAGGAKVGEAAAPHMASITAAANKLAATPADDIEKVRLAFGELSKPVVDLLIAAPDAAKKYRMFECPMAKGFKRWAQLDPKMANPYMGAKMLECGSEIHAHHTGMKGGDMKHDMGGAKHDMGGAAKGDKGKAAKHDKH